MKIVVMMFVVLSPLLLDAQSFFAQKKTKLKYIAQQIALLKLYGGYVKKGYSIASGGLKFINDVKHGDFDLHDNYFNSLTAVNSSVKDYAQKDSTESIQEDILKVGNELDKFISDNDNLQQAEKDYINKVMSNLLFECRESLSQFILLTNDTAFALKDNERLKRIDALITDLKDKYAFAQDFENSVKMLALSRAKTRNDINTSKLLYGIKQQ